MFEQHKNNIISLNSIFYDLTEFDYISTDIISEYRTNDYVEILYNIARIIGNKSDGEQVIMAEYIIGHFESESKPFISHQKEYSLYLNDLKQVQFSHAHINDEKGNQEIPEKLVKLGITRSDLWYDDRYNGTRKIEEYHMNEIIKWEEEKKLYGFDNREIWNLDETIAIFILPRLLMFQEHIMSSEYDETPAGLTKTEWLDILDEMMFSFKCIIKHEIFDEELDGKINKRYKKGLKLFVKYLPSLWT